MTWTSEMSGTASSGVCSIAQAPHSASAMPPMNTSTRLCVHQRIRRSIMRAHRTMSVSCFDARRAPFRVTVTVASHRPFIITSIVPR